MVLFVIGKIFQSIGSSGYTAEDEEGVWWKMRVTAVGKTLYIRNYHEALLSLVSLPLKGGRSVGLSVHF